MLLRSVGKAYQLTRRPIPEDFLIFVPFFWLNNSVTNVVTDYVTGHKNMKFSLLDPLG